MSEATQRTHKLLILAGDQGPAFEARDFKKVTDVIINGYLATAKQQYQEYLLEIIPAVVRRIPLKQHIYAALTGQIQRVNHGLSLNIVKKTIKNLQLDINNLQLHQSINGLYFLSQLMNLQKLNSQLFLDLLDDIISYLENCKNSGHRAFLSLLFSRTLPNFCYSLNKKVFFEFKKLMERGKKLCNKNIEFMSILECQQKGVINDGSIIHRLYQEPSQSTSQQIQQNIKLSLKLNEQTQFRPIEYQMPTHQSQKDYEQFIKSYEAHIHIGKIQQIIQLMKLSCQFALQKINVYINDEQAKNSFMQRFLIDVLIGKALKSKNNIVQTNILVKIVKSSHIYAELCQKALRLGLVRDLDHFDLACQIRYSQVASFIINNWPGGNADMTDIPSWDWEKFIPDGLQKNFEQNKQKEQYKRSIVLKLICSKLILLNENFKIPECLKKYAPPQKLTNPAKYKAVQQMEALESFQQILKNKGLADEILPLVKTESDYQIFLQALFEKTSQSHTHLQILIKRYQKVLQKFKQDYDWTLINTIRSYWSKSLFHRLLYLQTVIQNGLVDFESYVKNINKVDTENQQQKHWIKLELNELIKKFDPKL